MLERDKRVRVAGMGPFTGRQLTTIVCVAIVAMTTIPTAALAASGAFTSDTAAPAVVGKNTSARGIGVQGTGKRYGVFSKGPLGVADGKSLRCSGCVEPGALSPAAQAGTLKSGQSVSGPYAVAIVDPTMRFVRTAINYARPLAAPVAGNRFIYTESWPVSHCAGPGKADRGYLCAYSTVATENINAGLTKLFAIGTAAGRSGAVMGFAPLSSTGFTESVGSYTLTAP